MISCDNPFAKIHPYLSIYKEISYYLAIFNSLILYRGKIYNTIRELSNHAYELFALRSLGYEIFSSGPGNGFNWLQEHIGEDYIAAWFEPGINDAAIVNSGMSRWHNYYVEGLDWLAKYIGIDGLYLDEGLLV